MKFTTSYYPFAPILCLVTANRKYIPILEALFTDAIEVGRKQCWVCSPSLNITGQYFQQSKGPASTCNVLLIFTHHVICLEIVRYQQNKGSLLNSLLCRNIVRMAIIKCYLHFSECVKPLVN